MECDPDAPPECGVPTNANIELRFDRHLLPSTVVRQSVEVSTGAANVFLQPSYDLVERVVVFRLTDGAIWQPGARYTVRLRRANEDPDGWGLRAFDGSDLDPSSPAGLELTFRVRRALSDARPPDEAPTWDSVHEVLSRGGCGSCHGGDQPSMGLDLASPQAIERTAMGKAAHQTESEPAAIEPYQDPVRFGVQMPLIDKERPDNSYLFYKLLINPGSYAGDCDSVHEVKLSGCVSFPAKSVSELRDWFVMGHPMPLGGSQLTLDDLRIVQRYIASGAPLPTSP